MKNRKVKKIPKTKRPIKQQQEFPMKASHFLLALQAAMLELHYSERARIELLRLCQFLAIYYGEGHDILLNEDRIVQLTSMIRLESVDKTRANVIKLIGKGYQLNAVIPCGDNFLIRCGAVVNFLENRKYPVNRNGELVCFGSSTLAVDNFYTDQKDKVDRRHVEPKRETIRRHFLSFIVNMFASHSPGCLLYDCSSPTLSNERNDFFILIDFILNTLLQYPMNLAGIYKRIYQDFTIYCQRQSIEVSPQTMRSYCAPIISHNWQFSVLHYSQIEGLSFDEKAFLKICKLSIFDGDFNIY